MSEYPTVSAGTANAAADAIAVAARVVALNISFPFRGNYTNSRFGYPVILNGKIMLFRPSPQNAR
jgi:hypothetical protein